MTTSLNLVEFLNQTQLFQGLPLDQLQALEKIAICQQYKKNEFIFLEGEQAQGFFIIQSGQVKLFKTSADGKEQILHWFSTGEHFAEVPAFDGQPYPASAKTLELTTLLFFTKTAFFNLLHQEPTLAINLIATLSRYLRRFAHLIENLSLREVPERLAIYLLKLSEQNNHSETLQLNLTKTQLSAFLGTIPETLSRVFAKLSQEEIIKIQGSVIYILDREKLQNLTLGK